MPADYTIDPHKRLLVVRFWGRVTRDNAVDLRRRVSSDPAFDRTFSDLIDFSDVTAIELSAADLQHFGAWSKSFTTGPRPSGGWGSVPAEASRALRSRLPEESPILGSSPLHALSANIIHVVPGRPGCVGGLSFDAMDLHGVNA